MSDPMVSALEKLVLFSPIHLAAKALLQAEAELGCTHLVPILF